MYLLTLNKEHTPYRKPDNDPIYIHKHSNHPQNIFRDLPKSISKKVTDTSSNEETFNNHIPIYQEALKNSAFNNYLFIDNLNITVTNDVDGGCKFYYGQKK